MASSLWGLRQTEDEREMARKAAAEMSAAALTDPALPAAGKQEEEVETDEMPDPEGEVEVDVDDGPEVTGDIPEPEEDTIGIGEHARDVIRQETGKKADEILNGGDDLYTRIADMFGISREGSAAALTHVAPFARQLTKMSANIEERNLGKLLDGNYSDEEIEEIVSASGDVLRNSDEEIKRLVQTDPNPTVARRKLLQMAAEDELRERAKTRQGAEADLANKKQTTWGKIAGGTLENAGYVNSFIYGSTMAGGLGLGITASPGASALGKIGVEAVNTAINSAPASVAGAAERATRMMKKDYAVDADGELQVIDNNYGEMRSLLQGGAGGFVENTVVEGGTDIAIDLACLGLSKIPGAQAFIVQPLKRMGNAAVKKMMGNAAGRALIRVGKGYNAVSQFTQFDSQPVEMLEENIQPIWDNVFGLDKKRGEYRGVGEEAAEYAKQQFNWETQKDIFYGLIGTCLIQAGAGGITNKMQKRAPGATTAKEAASVLTDYANVPKEKVATLTDEEKIQLADAYRTMSDNPDKLIEFAQQLGAKSEAIMDGIVNREGARMNERMRSVGLLPTTFSIPLKDENGKKVPDFKKAVGIDGITGKTVERMAVVDPDCGVTIYDNGVGAGSERAYTVENPHTRQTVDVPNLALARKTASLFKNDVALMAKDRENKAKYIHNVWQSKYGNVPVELCQTMEQAVEFSKRRGVDVTQEEGFTPDRPAWHLNDGTIVMVSDNISSPYEVDTLFQHEIIGHNNEAMRDEFMANLDSKAVSEAQQVLGLTDEQMSDPRTQREVFANVIQQRRHNPSVMQKIKHFINEKRRAAGEKTPISDADLEVFARKWEDAAKGNAGNLNIEPAPDVARTEAEPEVAEVPEEEEEVAEVEGEIPDTEAIEPAAPKEEEKKPVSERSVIEKMTEEAPVEELNVSEVFNDDTRIPNFKEGANPETGEVEPLQGEPYDLVSNPIVVMEFKDGKKVVATGRHRLALYKRAGREKIAARVIREKDGWTVDDARMIDAVGNIIDEKGSVKDYVRYYDDAKTTREDAERGGFLSRKKGALAYSIHEGATDDTKAAVDWEGSGSDGMISTEQAGIISEAAPKDAHPRNKALQRILVTKALNGLRGKKLAIVARSLAEEVKTAKTVGGAGGEMQLDLFSSAEDLELLAMEDKRAEYRVGKANEYNRIAENLRTAMSKGGKLDLNAEYAKELGITDPKDKKQLAAARDKAVERANYWENAIRLNAEDKAAMDAEIGASAKKAEGKKSEIAEKLNAIKQGKTGKKSASDKKDAEKSTQTEAKPAPEAVKTEKSVKSPDKSRAKERQKLADAASSVLGIPIIGFGKNGEVEYDSTKAAEEAISRKSADNTVDKITDAIPVDARDGLIDIHPDERYGDGAYVVYYAPGGKEEFDSAVAGIREEFSEFDVRTPIDGQQIVLIPKKAAQKAATASVEPSVRMKDKESEKKAEAIYAEAEKAYNTQPKEGETNGLREPGRPDQAGGEASPGVSSEGGAGAAEGRNAVSGDAGAGENASAGTVAGGGNRSGSGVSVQRPEMGERPVHGGGAEEVGEGAAGGASVAGHSGRRDDATGEGPARGESGVQLEPVEPRDVGGRDGEATAVATAHAQVEKDLPNTVKNENYIITDADERAIEGDSPRKKFKTNVEAIRIVRKLAEDGRAATSEERETLARYVGWGGLKDAFNPNYVKGYEEEQTNGTITPQRWALIRKSPLGEEGYNLYKEMRQLLTEKEINSAEQSTASSFFTPIRLCRAVHKALAKSGLKGGRFLETSAGIGNLIGTGNYTGARWTAVEYDEVSGQILKALYPKANVRIQGFEDVQVPNDFYDAAVSNVPFGTSHPFDADYKKYGFVIHDFFFAKAVDKVHPGGVIALITSTGTLDKRDKKLIRYLNEHGGQIVGAVRMPNGFFKKNAGTDVATDVIFIQKVEGKADNSTFIETTEVKGCDVAKYFVDHPEMCIGEMVPGTNQFGEPAMSYKAGKTTFEDIENAIGKAADSLAFKSVAETQKPSQIVDMVDSNGLANGNVGVVGNKIVRKINGELVEVPKDEIKGLTKKLIDKGVTPQKIVSAISSLRNAHRAVIDGQLADCSDEELKRLQGDLNREYDTFVRRYGHLHDRAILNFVNLDYSAAPLMLEMEDDVKIPDGVDKKGNKRVKHIYKKMDVFTKRTIFSKPKVTHADSVLDGLRISLNETGSVDTARIAELTGKPEEEVRKELMDSGRVFVNPETSGLETRDEYLSGSVRRKLKAARAAAEVDESFKRNVEELEKVPPEDIAATDISYQIGQNWIPQDIYEQFYKEVVFQGTAARLRVSFDPREHLWHVDNARGQTEWDEENGLAIEDLLERTMNGQSIVVRRKVGEKEYVIDQQATTATKIVQEKIAKAFQSWMTDDIDRANRLERLYNDLMNDNVQRKFDTDVLELNGISERWGGFVNTPGREYQKRCIARGAFGGNLLIAHCVGAGKTFEMASICMQLRKLGIARKPMFAVPNHMLEQWNREFHEAYPGAKILVATKNDLDKDHRRAFLARAANGDWDCVIVAHSSFSRIAMSPEHQAEYIESELAELRDVLANAESKKDQERIKKKIQSLNDKLKSLLDPSKKDDAIKFEEMGCDYLFIDEAHNFKGLQINTHMSNVPGVTGSVSQRAQDLEMKCRYIAKLHGSDKGVVFATGTPISNSISEMYVMMRYLAPTKMDDMGVRSFDDWAKQFGQVVNEWSPNPSGVGFREKARFSQFQNVPEMKNFFRSFSDIVLDGDLKIRRPKPKEIKHVLKPSAATKAYVLSLNERMERMQSSKVDPREDNMLKVTTEGRLLAIDPALIGVKDDTHTRANACADEVKRVYDASTGKWAKDRDGKDVQINGTQLIFCDSGVPKKKQFKELVRDSSGNYQLASGYWNFTVTAPDAYGARQAFGQRVDGRTITFSGISDHSIGGLEDLASVYSALEGLAMKANAVNAESKLGKGTKKAKKPEGESVDINGWLDMNSDRVGYDPRFSSPFVQPELSEAAPETDEDQEAADDKDTSDEANGDVEVDNMLRGKFNMYAELRKQLIRRGIPAEEIAFIHDAETMTQKQALFDKVKKGQIRVLIGNTAKMGEGTNVQDALCAIHHLDIPWKPAWITQRDGRGIRSGNMNEEVEIHKYITEGTFDVYSWDTVGRKAKFIENAMNARMDQRVIEDVDSTVMSLEEGKAAAAGDPRILERVKLIKAVEKKQMEFDTQVKASDRAKLKLRVAENELMEAEKKTAKYTDAIKRYNEAKGENPFTYTAIGDTTTDLTDNTEIARAIQDRLAFFARKGSSDGIVGKVFGFDLRYSREKTDAKIEIREIGVEMPVTILPGTGAAFPPTDLSKLKTQITNHTSERALQGFDEYLTGYRRRVDVARKGVENSKGFDRDAASSEIGEMYLTLAKLNKALGIKDASVRDITLAHAQEKGLADEIKALEDKKADETEGEQKPGAEFATVELDPKRVGIAKRDIENQARRLGRTPFRPKPKTWPEVYQRSEAMLNQTGFVENLVEDAAKYARPLTAEQTLAVGEYQLALGQQYAEIRELRKETESDLENADPSDTEYIKEVSASLRSVKEEESKIAARYATCYKAFRMSKAEQGRALAANRAQFSDEFDFLGMKESRQAALGRDLTPEEMKNLHDICDRARDLDEEGRAELWAAVHAQAEKTIKDLFFKDGVKRSGTSRGGRLTDYRKKYLDAMKHLEIYRDTVGGSLIGITGDEYGTWNKPIFDLLLYHRFVNPDITASEALKAVTEDVNTYIEADEQTVARILTGFERSWDINRHDDVLKGGRDLRSQILTQLQIEKLLNKEMPGKTGPIQADPSEDLRNLRHTRDVLKNDLAEETGDPRKLQSRQKRWMKWYDNRIEDLKREIAAGERLPQSKKTLEWTDEMRAKRAEYEALVEERDRVCGPKLSEEERVKLYEKSLEKTLRRAIEKLQRAKNDDFRRPDKRETPTSDYIESLKKAIEETNKEWRQEKKDRLNYGRTAEELRKFNDARERTRTKRVQYWQALTAPNANRAPVKRPPIPMPLEQQARYDELGRQMKKLRRQVLDMRAHDELLKKPWAVRNGIEYLRFVNGITRGFLATADHSAVLRQMAQLSQAHPLIAAQVFKNTVGTAFSDEKAQKINAEYLSDPRIREAVDKGWLNWRNLEAEGGSNDVEMFSTLHTSAITIGRNPDGTEKRLALDDIKGVGAVLRGSERIYASYINALSAEIYLALTNADTFTAKLLFGQSGLTDFTKKEIAARINMANGSAQIDAPRKKQFMNQLTGIFWAPKLALSRAQLAVGWDIWHPLFTKEADVKTRLRTAAFNAIEHGRAKVAMIALGTMMLMLAGDGDDKEKWRRASLFQKFIQSIKPRVGATTLDFSGGEAGWYQLMAKWATLEKETGTGKTQYLAAKDGHKKSFGANVMTDTFRFAQGKFNPLLSNSIALWTGEDYTGQPFGLGKLAVNTFIPLGASDITSAFVENGLGRGLLLSPFIVFGAGGNTYPIKRYDVAVNQFTEAAKEYDKIRENRDIDDDEKGDMLQEIENNVPELKSRGRIEAEIKTVKDFDRQIRALEKLGVESKDIPKSLIDGRERAKNEVLELIRQSR